MKKRLRPEAPILTDEQILKKKEKKKRIIITLVNTVVLYVLYLVLMQFDFFQIPLIIYLSVLTVLGLGYVFYNRGFSRKNLTIDMLPSSWSEEKKIEYLEDGKRRLQKSQWCLYLIFPLVFTLFMDIFYLYIYVPYFSEVIGSIFRFLA